MPTQPTATNGLRTTPATERKTSTSDNGGSSSNNGVPTKPASPGKSATNTPTKQSAPKSPLKSGVDVSQIKESDVLAFIRFFDQFTTDMENARTMEQGVNISKNAEQKLKYFMESSEKLHNPARPGLVYQMMYSAPRVAKAQYRLMGKPELVQMMDNVISTPARGNTPAEDEMLGKLRKIMPLLESNLRQVADNSSTLGEFLYKVNILSAKMEEQVQQLMKSTPQRYS